MTRAMAGLPVVCAALAVGCAPESPAEPEPLVVPDDPAAWGMPVGVRTLDVGELRLEVWYPASDAHAGDAGSPIDPAEIVPQAFFDRVGDVELPEIPSRAVRDAAVRDLAESVPALFFSHGFGGWRTQSNDLATHLASRGHVVVAADHPGRMFGDVLPCVFEDPSMEGCTLFGDDADPGQTGLWESAAWILGGGEGAEDVAGLVDGDSLGLFGHSAGGGSVSRVGTLDDRFDAVAVLAAGPDITRDVPVLTMDGTCDGVITRDQVLAGHGQTPGSTMVDVVGAGHQAFADVCSLELVRLAEEVLLPRTDVDPTLLDQMLVLAADGCADGAPIVPGCGDAFLPWDVSAPIVRHYVAAFFEEQLAARGPGVQDGVFPEAALVP